MQNMSSCDEIELSIVMPCLNEARTLPICLQKARMFLSMNKVRGEIIVADNGSTDGSLEILAKQRDVRVVSVDQKGYGAALSGGIAAAHGQYVIMADADDSYNFSFLMPLLEKLRDGYDLVMGNRFKGEIQEGAMPKLNRYLGNPVLSALGRLFFSIPIGDFHCGLRGFNRQSIIDLNLQTTGMEYASEMIVCAALNKLKITEVPVTLYRDGRDRKPHLSPWRDGWRHLRFLLLYSPRWLYVYPGTALIAFGLVMGGLTLPAPFMLADDIGLDVHTLLVACMAILVGVQCITFGFIARVYAINNRILPARRAKDSLLDNFTLEHLLIIALILVLGGMGGIAWAVHKWSLVHFGALHYRDSMRVLIVAVTSIVGGLQLGLSAFLLGVMQIKKK